MCLGRIRKQTIQRFRCLHCEVTFTLNDQRKESKFTSRYQEEIAKRYFEDRSSFRIIARRNSISRSKSLDIIQELIKKSKPGYQITKELNPAQYGGVLGVDGTFISVRESEGPSSQMVPLHKAKKKTEKNFTKVRHLENLFYGIDPKTRDIPHHVLGSTESIETCKQLFQGLKDSDYPLKAIIRDGNDNINTALEEVYGEQETPIITQLCVKHFMESIDGPNYLNFSGVVKKRRKIRQLQEQVRSGRTSLFDKERKEYDRQRRELEVLVKPHIWKFQIHDLLWKLFHQEDYERCCLVVKELLDCFDEHMKRHRLVRQVQRKFERDLPLLLSWLMYPELNIPRYNNILLRIRMIS